MKLWIEKFIAAIAFQEEEEEEERRSGSRCLVGEERGRIIKMRGNSIPVGEEKKNASMQMYERVLWPIRHLFWARIGYCFASPLLPPSL